MKTSPIYALNLLMSLSLLACSDKEEVVVDIEIIDDVDNDGFESAEDCDDMNPAINPDATDVVGDGIDQNCDGIDGFDGDNDGLASISSGGTDCLDDDPDETLSAVSAYYSDMDGDGFGSEENMVEACEAPLGFVEDNTDCDDRNDSVFPTASEVCDGLDNDCDSLTDDEDDSISGQMIAFADVDEDGFGDADTSISVCEMSDGYTLDSSDCDDSNPMVHPNAEEVTVDGLDNDCDMMESCYEDLDLDGFGSEITMMIEMDSNGAFDCTATAGASATWSDCDDNAMLVNPDAAEICDELDNDCDMLIDDEDTSLDTSTGTSFFADLDGDGYGDDNSLMMACEETEILSLIGGDCNDSLASSNPMATDIIGDGIDQNCDSVDGTDSDGDGVASIFSGGNDCDDTDVAVGSDTDFDEDGSPCSEDCDDTNNMIYPEAEEITGDGIDQNCDGIDPQFTPFIGDLDRPSQSLADMICASHNVVYGDIDIDLDDYVNGNSVLSCLEEIHGYLEISDGTASSVVSFPNLTLVAASLYLYDSGSYDFPLLETVGASFEISNNTTSMILDGDILFPSLSSVPENVFISYNSGFTSIEGFSNLTNIGESLEIYENQNITNISGFEGLNVLDMLIIGNNQNLLDISGFTYLESLNYVELYDNPGLVSSTGISEVQSIFSSDIYDNDQLLDPGCDFFSLDSILPDSNVYLFASLFDNDFASCDIDGDGFNLNDGDCDDQDASLELLDTDGDAWTTCDGDCNDGDLTIYPTNTDVWYDGIDSDCDGENDYDQDGDGDNSDLHGGTDCDDLDPVLQGLDLDGDLLTTCDGDDIELVASCLDYLAAGSTTDGMYTLLFLGGSTLDVYCDMTTQGGGWTLFATTTSDKCAEDLPYGPDVPLSTSGAAYLSTAFQDETHSEFLQDFRADGVATSFSIVYDFGNAKTVSDRFIDAGNSGEGVSWNVETVSNTYSYSGTWWYSSGADTSGKWSSSDVDSFSDDDGSWGATNGTVDGDGGGDLSSGWGHENQDGGDSNCSNYYENGSSSSSSNIINLMYFR